MNNRITVVALIALIAVGCNQEKNIEFSSESFTEKELPICKNSKCPEVTINYVEIIGARENNLKNIDVIVIEATGEITVISEAGEKEEGLEFVHKPNNY